MPLSLVLLSYVAFHFGAMAKTPEGRRRLFNILKKFLITVWSSIAVLVISFFLLIVAFGHWAEFNDVVQGMQHYTALVPYDGDVMLHVRSDGPI